MPTRDDETPLEEESEKIPTSITFNENEGEESKQAKQMFQRQNTEEADNTTVKVKNDGGGDVDRNKAGDVDRNKANRYSHVRRTESFKRPNTNVIGDLRYSRDKKVVGMKDGLRAFLGRTQSNNSWRSRTRTSLHGAGGGSDKSKAKRDSIEKEEEYVRSHQENRALVLAIVGNLAALKVMFYYLITLDSLLACALSVGLTIFWYYYAEDDPDFQGGGMDWVILGFAVVTPMSASIGIAFRRREEALLDIAKIRSFSYQLYLAHCVWDWDTNGRACSGIDWLDHTDAVLAQLIGIGDELARFLSLPTASRSRHRMTRSGRREAALTVEVAYRLFDSLYTRRMTRLTIYTERLKTAGLQSGEISRMRQYERFIGESIEHLRMVKMYRSPQALRSFARIFTLLLPPFYAPTYAQIARDLDSLGYGIAFAVIVAIALTALFESIQVLEDPFVAYLTLDGIDVREEFEVLHYSQLVRTRELIFPYAPPFPEQGRAALDEGKTHEPMLKKPARHMKTGSLDSAVYSALSYGSREDDKGFGSAASVDGSAQEKKKLEDDELGVPLSLKLPVRKRTSSHALYQFDPPPSAGGSISGSERTYRRKILQSTG